MVYHSFSKDTYDALDAAASAPTFSTLLLDGHGRAVESDQHTQNAGGGTGTKPDTLKTLVSYLATGEPTSVTRTSAVQGQLYTRWMQYDSLGRMVLNVEPNTSTGFVAAPGKPGTVPAGLKAWKYAYDALSQVVGTEDARGCGTNFTYDGAGRETSEDYIPCSAGQPAHTPVDLATGAGAEVFNIYDAAEAGEPDANSGGAAAAPFLVGKLTATYSRGEHTQFAFDGRGRVTTVYRQLPNPPGLKNGHGHAPSRYAPTWYQTSTDYDEASRPISQSTGADLPALMGSVGSPASVLTVAYDARSIPTSGGGSYGVLASGEQRDANGLLLSRAYGDLAKTTATYTYDSRKRLSTANISRATAPSLWSAPSTPSS